LTSRPLSTISYNTEPFLIEKLEQWQTAHLISEYQYILHKGEDGDKDHIHLRVVPNKSLDPMYLADALVEFVKGEELPRRCKPWRNSDEYNWLLYVLHNKDFLRVCKNGGDKGEKLPYQFEDIKASFGYDVENVFRAAMAKLVKGSVAGISEDIKQGKNPVDIAANLNNPYVVASVARLASTDKAVMQQDIARWHSSYNAEKFKLTSLVTALSVEGIFVEWNTDTTEWNINIQKSAPQQGAFREQMFPNIEGEFVPF